MHLETCSEMLKRFQMTPGKSWKRSYVPMPGLSLRRSGQRWPRHATVRGFAQPKANVHVLPACAWPYPVNQLCGRLFGYTGCTTFPMWPFSNFHAYPTFGCSTLAFKHEATPRYCKLVRVWCLRAASRCNNLYRIVTLRTSIRPLSLSVSCHRRTFRRWRDENSRNISRRRSAACMDIASNGSRHFGRRFVHLTCNEGASSIY